MRACVIALLIVLPAALPSPAAAQDVWGWSVIIPSVAQTDILGTMLRDQTRNARPRAPAAAPTVANPSALRFRPSTEARKANFARFVAERRKNSDVATVRELEDLLGDAQFMANMQSALAARGLRTDSMADAYAAWWIQAWQTSRGRTDDPSAAAIRSVKSQAERAMLANAGLTTLPDAKKQAFAEGLLVQAAILAAAQEQVKADPAQSRKLAQIARASARQIGLDLDAMTLTDAGFVDG